MRTTFRDREGEPTSFRRELQAQAARVREAVLREAAFEPFLMPSGGPWESGKPEGRR